MRQTITCSDCGWTGAPWDGPDHECQSAGTLGQYVPEPGCVCRLGPDCPRPGKCDDSAVAAAAEFEDAWSLRHRAAVELAAEFGTDISEWMV